MQSLKELYKAGKGPSSSHTIGPERISKFIKQKYPAGYDFKVILYGSLAMTGEGHGTDRVIREVLNNVEIVFDRETENLPHPNTMDVEVYKKGEFVTKIRALSVGGGSVKIEGVDFDVEGQTGYADLLWEKKKILLFASDNQDGYAIAKQSDYKCYLLDDLFNIDDFLSNFSEE